jgi:hypothetical protein
VLKLLLQDAQMMFRILRRCVHTLDSGRFIATNIG